jgi:hypothetical protein
MDAFSPDVEPRTSGRPAPAFEVIDHDIHPVLRNGLSTIYPYMPPPWQERYIRNRATIEGANNVPA